MTETIFQIAKRYVEIIEKIEITKDPKSLQEMEEARIEFHGCIKKSGDSI